MAYSTDQAAEPRVAGPFDSLTSVLERMRELAKSADALSDSLCGPRPPANEPKSASSLRTVSSGGLLPTATDQCDDMHLLIRQIDGCIDRIRGSM